MPAIPHNITRSADDGGPAVLVLLVLGHTLRMEKGKTVQVKLDPEKHSGELRSLRERYSVEEAVAEPTPETDPALTEFLKAKPKRRPAPEPSEPATPAEKEG